MSPPSPPPPPSAAKVDPRGLPGQLGELVRVLEAMPFLRGSLVEGIEFTVATAKQVPHKLGKKPRGFFVVLPESSGSGITFDCTARDATTITLNPSASGVASFWFF